MSGHAWAWFIGRRLVTLVVLLVVISFAVFSLQYIAPRRSASRARRSLPR